MHIFLDVAPELMERSTSAELNVPRWFAAPLVGCSDTIRVGRSLREALRSARAGEKNFLIFNVDIAESLFVSLPRRQKRVISLFQWKPRNQSSYQAYHARQWVLRRSDMVATYSRISECELQNQLGSERVKWIPHFVDTDYFSPVSDVNVEDFFLCVGDHLRLENILEYLSIAFNRPVVRVTSDPRVRQYYLDRQPANIKLLFRIPFEELRQLYSRARMVINPVDDRYWPVGITTFCEALAMARPIVTSGNHSCSGYLESLSRKEVRTVIDVFDKSKWISNVGELLEEGRLENTSGRATAETHCSFQSMTAVWRQVIEEN